MTHHRDSEITVPLAELVHENDTAYGTFRLNFHRFDHFELDLRGHTQLWGAAFSCLRLKWADKI